LIVRDAVPAEVAPEELHEERRRSAQPIVDTAVAIATGAAERTR